MLDAAAAISGDLGWIQQLDEPRPGRHTGTCSRNVGEVFHIRRAATYRGGS
jgi:hypothetical protein